MSENKGLRRWARGRITTAITTWAKRLGTQVPTVWKWLQGIAAITTPAGWRSLIALTMAYALHMSCLTLVVYSGALIGQEFYNEGLIPQWCISFPKGSIVVGKAASVWAVLRLINKYGRRQVYANAPWLAMAVSVFIAVALANKASWGQWSFWMVCLGIMVLGGLTTVMHTYRFAAMEVVNIQRSDTQHALALAVAIIMFGGSFAGYLGPEIALWARSGIPNAPWAGSFAALSVLMWVAIGALKLYEEPREHFPEHHSDSHPQLPHNKMSIWKQPTFQVAVSALAVAFFTNELMVTAAPLGMGIEDGHSLSDIKVVIQTQQAMMYMPGLVVSQWFIKRWGRTGTAGAGIAVYGIAIFIGSTGNGFWHYWWSMFSLGLAWNFMYVSSASLLWASQTENGGARRVQFYNDQLVAFCQVIASLSAGWLQQKVGWHNMLAWCGVLIFAQLLVTARYWRKHRHLP